MTEAVHIPVFGGHVALVDADDAEGLLRFSWHLVPRRCGGGYARRNLPGGTAIMMHRQILGLERGDQRIVDHINRDPLDNRKSNLRIATPLVNSHNANTRKDNSSGLSGVHQRPNGTWQVRLTVAGRRHSLGHFQDRGAAIRARDTLNQIVADLLSHIGNASEAA